MVYNIGIVGYGNLGQYLVKKLLEDDEQLGIQLAFVWNRTVEKLQDLPSNVKILHKLEDLLTIDLVVDLIVEVCHPDIIHQHGELFLQRANLLIGSTTALVNGSTASRLQSVAKKHQHRVYLTRGALWGANDIARMATSKQLESVKVSMYFHPESFRLPDGSPLKQINDELCQHARDSNEFRILFEGPVREICSLAPNNVNTMATAAFIGLGFDRTIGCLVSDLSLKDHHRVIVEVKGVQRSGIPGATKQFEVHTRRYSPTSNASNVSSLQTYGAFWQSVLECFGLENESHSQIRVC